MIRGIVYIKHKNDPVFLLKLIISITLINIQGVVLDIIINVRRGFGHLKNFQEISKY